MILGSRESKSKPAAFFTPDKAALVSIGNFEDDLANMSNADRAFFMDKVKELRGKNLACFCPLDRACHADTLLQLANEGPGD